MPFVALSHHPFEIEPFIQLSPEKKVQKIKGFDGPTRCKISHDAHKV